MQKQIIIVWSSEMQPEKPRIIIVDDEEVILQAVKGSLEDAGYDTQVFLTAADALNNIQESGCELVISDINMPAIDGMQFLSKLKESFPHIPVLLISGFGDIPKAVRAVKAGAFDFIEKPLSEAALYRAVEDALERPANKLLSDLSEAELQILKLVAEGKNSTEIAEYLERSVRTVENHRYRMMKKLGISNLTGLVCFARSAGLI